MPGLAKRRLTRFFILFCFGRAYGGRYQKIIDSFDGRYGLPMAEGLQKAKVISGRAVSIVADCGTGTGFVTRQAAEIFPEAAFLAFDLLPNMLRQARVKCEGIGSAVLHVQADNFALPLADESVDLVLAQNTMPCFSEFARVCRPGALFCMSIVLLDGSLKRFGGWWRSIIDFSGWLANVSIWVSALLRKRGRNPD